MRSRVIIHRRACVSLSNGCPGGKPAGTARRTHLLPTAVGHSVIYGSVLALQKESEREKEKERTREREKQGAEEGLLAAKEEGGRFQGGGGRPTLLLVPSCRVREGERNTGRRGQREKEKESAREKRERESEGKKVTD